MRLFPHPRGVVERRRCVVGERPLIAAATTPDASPRKNDRDGVIQYTVLVYYLSFI